MTDIIRICETNTETRTMTRRAILGGGIVCAVASIIPRKMLAEITASTASTGNIFGAGVNQGSANLYAFAGAQPGTTAIAATWPVHAAGSAWTSQKDSRVKIHAGSQSWVIPIPDGATHAALWEQNGCRIFVGNVATPADAKDVALKAIVVEVPDRKIAGTGPLEIWAERFSRTGSRQRIGSPFVTAILAEDASLAKLYHSLSPSEDGESLAEGIAKAIAVKARRGGLVHDPDAHGRRLASRLLPDVLRYDPNLPAGFTFAAQNGRHPEEASALVVDTILNGTPAFPSGETPVRLRMSFPYFSQHASIA